MQIQPQALSIADINKILKDKGEYTTTNYQEMDKIIRAEYSGNVDVKFIFRHFLDVLKNPELTDCLEFRISRVKEDDGTVSKCLSMVNTKTNEKIKTTLKNEPDVEQLTRGEESNG